MELIERHPQQVGNSRVYPLECQTTQFMWQLFAGIISGPTLLDGKKSPPRGAGFYLQNYRSGLAGASTNHQADASDAAEE